MMRPMTLADRTSVTLGVRARAVALDEHAFRAFYDATAPRLHAFLRRSLAGHSVADDLLQEAYLRFLRSGFDAADDDHRTAYLFRIAGNLVRDHFRSPARREVELPPEVSCAAAPGTGVTVSDLDDVLAGLSPRDRSMLWLAYVEGASHKEIAESLGLRRMSLKSMLFRARRRLAAALRARGLEPAGEPTP
jgi:RNA polymerase sigma-70 factor (ECF subfamily)